MPEVQSPESLVRQKPAEMRRRGPVADGEVSQWVEWQFDGLSYQKIAQRAGRDPETVSRHLQKPFANELRKSYSDDIAQRAKMRLRGLTDRAIASWEKQLDLADEGQRANHLVAKDLLTHAGTIDIAVPKQHQGTQILIQIGAVSDENMTIVEAEAVDEEGS